MGQGCWGLCGALRGEEEAAVNGEVDEGIDGGGEERWKESDGGVHIIAIAEEIKIKKDSIAVE